MLNQETIQQAFENFFNARPVFIVRAPGRVNLIGEHTDYNDGFVLPMAIDHAVWIALRPRDDSVVRINSLDLKLAADFELDSLSKGEGWVEYLKGVAHELQIENYKLRGWEGVMAGDVPIGAGLSSSAAVELATTRAFASVSGFEWDAVEMAKIGQKAENHWVGVNCGIMDQMASAASKAGHALFLDCRSLEIQHVPVPADVAVVVMDTSTRRGLVDSAYNERRSQCEQAARYFGVKALRDVGVNEFEERRRHHPATKGSVEGKREVSDAVWRRAKHIITEDQRVLDAIKAMHMGDIKTMGKLFNESHMSLRDDFEVTNEALNQIVESALEQGGCYGARMTGAGFGGCAVALVEKEKAQSFAEAVSMAYRQRSGLDASVYVCQASKGASLI
jgi:galactokinase